MNYRHHLQQNIRSNRKRLGYTQESFAIELNIKRATVGAYEEGRSTPPLDILLKMCRLFDCTVEEMTQAQALPNRFVLAQ